MKTIRVRGFVDVVMDVPKCISLEEIQQDFKQHIQNGKCYVKKILLNPDEVEEE